MNELIIQLLIAIVTLMRAQMAGSGVGDALLGIIRPGLLAYKQHTGEELNPDFIRAL